MTTSVGFGVYQAIESPPPLERPYGLLQSATNPRVPGVRLVPGDDRWMNGVDLIPHTPHTGDVYDECAPGSFASQIKDDGDVDIDIEPFGAFAAYLPVTCKTFRIDADFRRRALEVFEVIEGSIAAHEFMHGTRLPTNPHLADGEGVFPNGDTVTSLRNGVALLEAEIATSYRGGVIHVSPGLLTALNQPWAILGADGAVRTINGTLIVPDAGYAGANPNGHATASGTTEWMFASGPVDIRRNPDVTMLPETDAEAIDRGVGYGAEVGRPNGITVRVERFYSIVWDQQVQAAVRVDRCKDTC